MTRQPVSPNLNKMKRPVKSARNERQIYDLLCDLERHVESLQEENKRLKKERNAFKHTAEQLKSQYNAVKKQADKYYLPNHLRVPKEIDGWEVRWNEKGYYEIFKNVNNHIKILHIGKEWNAAKARGKISEFENKPCMILITITENTAKGTPFCGKDCCIKAGYNNKDMARMEYDVNAHGLHCVYCGENLGSNF